ncbi:MAG: cation-translocating P-type ATPase, partial [Patescibacteria group bacterium]
VGAVREKNETLRTIEAVFPGIPSNLIDELPFSSKTKLSAVQILYKNAEVSLWLGAPESIIQGRAAKAQEDKLAELRRSGLRVLAFASGPASLKQRDDLNILAFIILRDELRPNVREAVSFFETRGIKLKVLSGDHPETVAAVAMQAGLKIADPVYIGADLDLLTPDEFKTAVIRGQIFGRLVPQQKQKIVKYLQETGEFVGMAGDGINDILALKQADIGIAMKSGAAAALDVADIVLLKNTFAHLPTLAQEGDRIIYNIKRVAKLFLTKNVYSLFFVLFSGFVGLPFPLSPRFITWIDLLTVGTPAFLLTLMSAHAPKQTVNDFLRETLGFSLIAGLIIALVSLIVYTDFFLWQNPMANYDKTAALSIVILMGLYIVYYVTPVERKSDSSLMQKAAVWAILAVGLILNVLAVYWDRLSGFIGLVALDAVSWFIIIAAAVVGSIAFHILLKSFRGI